MLKLNTVAVIRAPQIERTDAVGGRSSRFLKYFDNMSDVFRLNDSLFLVVQRQAEPTRFHISRVTYSLVCDVEIGNL